MCRVAVSEGIAPEAALLMATLHPARCHRLLDRGAVAPGARADLLLLDDLETFLPARVYKDGVQVAADGRAEPFARAPIPDRVRSTMRAAPVQAATFAIPAAGRVRVIETIPGQLITRAHEEEPSVRDGRVVADGARDLAKIAVVERHLGTGRIGLGFVRGFGLERGALASTVAHDAHNVVVVGMSDHDMRRAVRRLSETGGGVVVVDEGGVRAELRLPVAGLLSTAPLADVVAASRECVEAAQRLGCTLPSPFQSLAFLALSVIPSLKITDRGLVDVDRFQLVPLEADGA
jgi:adenine deaminase